MIFADFGGGGGHPHGGGGGGHHGGGHGGGYYRGGGGWRTDYVYPEYYAPTPVCPMVYAPVLATDNRIYDNECLALAAGQAVVKRLPPGAVVNRPGGFSGLGEPSPIAWQFAAISAVPGAAIGAGVGALVGRGHRIGAAIGGAVIGGAISVFAAYKGWWAIAA